MTVKQLIIILVVLIVVGIGAVLVRGFVVSTIPNPNPTVSPSLSPSPSPSPTSTSTVTTVTSEVFNLKIGEKAGNTNIVIQPTEILEDSRCPLDVQCIQAGTVRVLTYCSYIRKLDIQTDFCHECSTKSLFKRNYSYKSLASTLFK
jgi:hypothetical protein